MFSTTLFCRKSLVCTIASVVSGKNHTTSSIRMNIYLSANCTFRKVVGLNRRTSAHVRDVELVTISREVLHRLIVTTTTLHGVEHRICHVGSDGYRIQLYIKRCLERFAMRCKFILFCGKRILICRSVRHLFSCSLCLRCINQQLFGYRTRIGVNCCGISICSCVVCNFPTLVNESSQFVNLITEFLFIDIRLCFSQRIILHLQIRNCVDYLQLCGSVVKCGLSFFVFLVGSNQNVIRNITDVLIQLCSIAFGLANNKVKLCHVEEVVSTFFSTRTFSHHEAQVGIFLCGIDFFRLVHSTCLCGQTLNACNFFKGCTIRTAPNSHFCGIVSVCVVAVGISKLEEFNAFTQIYLDVVVKTIVRVAATIV